MIKVSKFSTLQTAKRGGHCESRLAYYFTSYSCSQLSCLLRPNTSILFARFQERVTLTRRAAPRPSDAASPPTFTSPRKIKTMCTYLLALCPPRDPAVSALRVRSKLPRRQLTTSSPPPDSEPSAHGQRRADPGADEGGRRGSGITSSCPTYMAGPGENNPRACLSWPLLRYLDGSPRYEGLL